MSEAKWCDYGNHAFKVDDRMLTLSKPGKDIVIRDQFGAHMGSVPGSTVEMCGDCAALTGLSNDVEAEEPAERHKRVVGEITNGDK